MRGPQFVRNSHRLGFYAGNRLVALASFCTMLVAANIGHSADAEFGRYLSTECLTCHGVAKPGDTIPNIYGHPESAFVEVIKAYRDKRLPNEVMQTIASRLKDDEIEALAAYFRTAKPPK